MKARRERGRECGLLRWFSCGFSFAFGSVLGHPKDGSQALLPTFVIGLREGVEAALIVGIVAGFLRQEGRRDALRPMWLGRPARDRDLRGRRRGLELLDEALPQRQQEGLETVVGAAAVGIVTFMIVWMKRNARGLSGELRGRAGAALASGSVSALVAMAFFAVIREGLETVVFLIAVLQGAEIPATAGLGAFLGLAVAVAIGALIYRGGIKLNLQRFFKVTGVVLVLVAAGLVANSLHTAHEAGWLNVGQNQALDLTWLVVPGTWTSALLTGMLGWQPQPTEAELIGYLAFLIPASLYVLAPGFLRRAAGGERRPACCCCARRARGLRRQRRRHAGRVGRAGSKRERGRDRRDQAHRRGLRSGHGQARRRPHDVQDHQRRHGPRERGRGAERRAHPRREGEPRGGAVRLVHAGPATGPVLAVLPGRDDRGHRRRHRRRHGVASAKDPLLAGAVTGYQRYVSTQAKELVKRVEAFVAAVKAGDVEKAKEQFAAARVPYETIEPVAESFGTLDPDIDARVNDVEKGQKWTGFHRIEQALWEKHSTKGLEPDRGQAARRREDAREQDRRRSPTSPTSWPTAPTGCWTRSPPRRSAAKRIATRTPT